MSIPKTWAQLRALSDDDLISEHDRMAQGHTSVGLAYYLDEIRRREDGRRTSQMLELTNQMAKMTKYILWLTALNAALVLVTVIVAFL